MKKIMLVLLGLMLTLQMHVMVGKVNAGATWVLRKERTVVQPNGKIETRCFVQTPLPEYSMCYELALRLAQADRKTLSARGKSSMVRVGNKEGEGVIIFYRCFPDTGDPRK
jgi:hypothetical protein